ncbi:hypothetical protein PCL_01405 [Purpureocillium lilacinum]|uniref:Uncharacterized protein n=1 Tax=Purpureocillium lilacinum TaxID=33203 RepID=A0A2U3E3E4_PURLI|nr:hypothetical protein PCL_01405 [Purpureocillium lilacinum]
MDGLDYPDSAVMDTDSPRQAGSRTGADGGSTTSSSRRSPMTKTRSLSDGGGTPSKLSPSPHIVEAARRTSKDDSGLHLRDPQTQHPQPPVTPRRDPRGRGHHHGLSLQMQSTHAPRQFTPPPAASNPYVKPPPLSPKLDHSQIFASPTNILPRRSRGLDFSRAATSLHHSTLAEQSSPDSSPTTADRAVNIPGRRDYGAHGPEQTSTSLWSVMGDREKMNMSSSLGSNHALSHSHSHSHGHTHAVAVASDSSTTSDDDLMDEDTDEAYVTTPLVKSSATMGQGPPGGPFGSPAMSSLMSFQQRQRPRKHPKKKVRAPLGLGFNLSAASLSKSPPSSSAQARRESISWQANQLHISSVEAEEGGRSSEGDASQEAQKGVVRRAPKTKTFARIRAALLEEGAPAEAETRREAEVVKQVRESDMDLEPRIPAQADATASTLSSPNMANIDADIPEEDMGEAIGAFKHHAIRKSKGKNFWDAFSESSSRTTPPPPSFLPRGSSSGVSEDAAMDSPSLAGPGQGSQSGSNSGPSAAEITRRINNKRRRDDDLDPISFKRRAVSPGMSVHNSPVLQSPMQRDSMAWGSRPGSTGGDKGSSAPSDTGSNGGTPANPPGRLNSKGRVGFQGMVDTNDGIMRMSIE